MVWCVSHVKLFLIYNPKKSNFKVRFLVLEVLPSILQCKVVSSAYMTIKKYNSYEIKRKVAPKPNFEARQF